MLAGSAELAVVGDGFGVGPQVGVEFADRFEQLAVINVGVLEDLEVEFEGLDDLEDTEDVAVPEEPFEALKFPREAGDQFLMAPEQWADLVLIELCRPGAGRLRGAEAFGHLAQDGEAHGDVEPVEPVLGLGVQEAGQVADVVGAVGQEGDLLV